MLDTTEQLLQYDVLDSGQACYLVASSNYIVTATLSGRLLLLFFTFYK